MLTSRHVVRFFLIIGFLSLALPGYAQNYYLSNPDLYKPPGESCTWVGIDPHPFGGAQAYLEIDGYTYWGEGQYCIDEYWADGWHNVTAIIYYWPDSGYQEWYPGYGGFNVYPPPPYIDTASSTGDNWDWVRLTGSFFQPDSYVVVYSYDWSYFQTYSGLNVSPDGLSLSFYLADGTLRHSFGWDGIHIQVVNNNVVHSNWALAQAPQPSISSGGPACADFYCIQLNGVFPLNAYVDFRIPGQSEPLQDYTSLAVTGSQITLRLNPSLRYAYDTTGLYAWAVNPSLTNGSNAYYLAPVDRRVTGFIEGISQQGSNYFLYGWACAKTYPGSIDVHVYVGGPAGGGGTFAFSGTANLASDGGIAAACNSTGSNYRFWLQIPQTVMAQYSGQQIYVHGISPFGLANLAIGNSGNVTIPGAPVISLKEYIYFGDRVLAVETSAQ